MVYAPDAAESRWEQDAIKTWKANCDWWRDTFCPSCYDIYENPDATAEGIIKSEDVDDIRRMAVRQGLYSVSLV